MGGFVVEGQVQVRDRDNLGGLGINQFEDIVEIKRDVNTLRNTRQNVHLMHASFHIAEGLGAFQRHCRLAGEGLEEGDVVAVIRLTREALAQRNPTNQAFTACHRDEQTRGKQGQASALGLHRRRNMVFIKEKRQALRAQNLGQRAVGRKTDIA